MSNLVHVANAQFQFDSLTLANPHGLQGGAYFSKLRIDEDPVLIQTPKCLTKNGIHKTEKKIYCDLMFDANNDDFINWIQKLESTIKNLIYEKRNLWFHNDMDYDSIDYHWQNLLRTYKGNKSLLRCFFAKPKGVIPEKIIQIYDEDEKMLSMDDVDKTSKLVSILEISGLKFTSQSFQIEFIVKQIMLIKNQPLFSKCLIKLNKSNLEDDANMNSDTDSDISIEDKVDVSNNLIAPDPVLLQMNTQQNKDKNDNMENDDEKRVILEIENDDEKNDDEKNDDEKNDDEKNDDEKNDDEKNDGNDDNVKEDLNKKKELVKASEEINKTKQINNDDDIKKEVLTNTEIGDPTDESELNKNNTIFIEKDLEETTIATTLEKNNSIINEIEILPPNESSDTVTLKNPNEVYTEIYKEAKRKAKDAKKNAVQAYLEAKRIKSLYLLNNIESSDDELEFEEYR